MVSEEEPKGVRHFFAVAQPDQARAEWAAADLAMTRAAIATSPKDGVEPVEAVGGLTGRSLALLGLGAGQIRGLGPSWPRRWLSRSGSSVLEDETGRQG